MSSRWENLTFSPGCGYYGFLKVVAIATFFWLVGFVMGRYWERSIEQKKNRQQAQEKVANVESPVAEPPKPQETLPHGIKQSQVGACLEYIEKNRKSEPYHGKKEGVSIEGAEVCITSEKITELTKEMDGGGNYDHFLGYLVKKGHIKKYEGLRGPNIYIWLPKAPEILPHGIQQSQVDACMEYIEKNRRSEPYHGRCDEFSSMEGATVYMMGETLDKLTTGMNDTGRYDHFLGYLVEKGHIKEYLVSMRGSNIYIWA